jgi:diguanylate cyclase (GGDEF)-like protein
VVTALAANSTPGKRRIVRLVTVFALTAVCLGSVVGLVMYADTHGELASQNWVDHSQDVLLNLAGVAQQLDRVELNARLYRLTGDDGALRSAQGAAVLLNTQLDRLTKLVGDNAVQERRARDLNRAGLNLSGGVDRLTPTEGSIREQVLECRRVLTLMQDEERTLLADRQRRAERSNLYSLARRIGTVVTGTVLILVLFGFLLRDAVRRGQFEEQISEANAKLQSSVERLEQQAWQSRFLIEARDEMGLCVEVKQAEECAVRSFERLLPGTAGRLSLTNNSRQVLESAGSWGMEAAGAAYEGFSPESCCALRSGRARWRQPQQSEVHCKHFLGEAPERYFCLPLQAQGETLGMVTVECATAEAAAMTEARESAVVSLAEMAAMAMAGLRLRHKLESQSIRDGMTGLFNRSFMEVALDRELQRASRHQRPVAVMMLDVDHFKQLNDSFGHEAGDVVLREVAECLRTCVRVEDIVCRYGGEEFVIILPELGARSAMERAETLRQRVGELGVRLHGRALRAVTISIGVAIYPEHADTGEELLRNADRALYAAKHHGRNRVVQAEGGVVV